MGVLTPNSACSPKQNEAFYGDKRRIITETAITLAVTLSWNH